MELKAFGERVKIRIGTLGAIRAEMSTVYKAAVRGELTWADATKAAYVLNLIANLAQGLGADERLSAIEARLAGLKVNGHAAGHDTVGRRL